MAEEKSLSREQQDQIRQAVDSGNRAEALALVAQFTGMDKDSARAYLQEMEELMALGNEPESGQTKEGSLTAQDWKTIDELILGGHTMTAIKLARSSGGYGLTEAKDIVDKREKELRAKSPEKFKKAKAGCAGKAALFLLAVGGVALTLILTLTSAA